MITETHPFPSKYFFQVPDNMFIWCHTWNEHFIIEYCEQKHLNNSSCNWQMSHLVDSLERNET